MKKIKLGLIGVLHRLSVMLFIPIDKLERWCLDRMKKEISDHKRTIGLGTFENAVYAIRKIILKIGIKLEKELNKDV